MDLESLEQKISSLQDMSVEEVEINYDTYFLTVETVGPSNLISGYSIKYKDISIDIDYTMDELLKTLERYEFYPKSYFEDILSKREEYSKRSNFIRKINDDIDKIKGEVFGLGIEIESYKKVYGSETDTIHFDRLVNEVNKIKDDLLNEEND